MSPPGWRAAAYRTTATRRRWTLSLAWLLGLTPRSATAHGLSNHPSGWIGILFDAGQIVLVVGFVILLALTFRDRSR